MQTEETKPINTDDWLLARDILIRGNHSIELWNGLEGNVITPDEFKRSIYDWQHFRVTGVYPPYFKERYKIENDFFLFCTRSNNCFSFLDPSEVKMMLDAQYRLPVSIWKGDHVIRKYRNVGEEFFSTTPVSYNNGKMIFNTDTPNTFVRRVVGSLQIQRNIYPELFTKLPEWVNSINFNVNIAPDFEHIVNIKLFGDNSREWERHGFASEYKNVPQSHLDLIETIAKYHFIEDVVENHE